MKKLLVILGLVVVMSVVTGCASMVRIDQREGYGWLASAKIDRVVTGFGYATSTTTAPNGNKVYIYELRSPKQDVAVRQGFFNQDLRYTNYSCKLSFEVDYSDKIIRYFWEGNECLCGKNEVNNEVEHYWFWNSTRQMYIKYDKKSFDHAGYSTPNQAPIPQQFRHLFH